MNVQKLIEVWDSPVKFSISEASEVDGKHVLGRVEGQFFVPDGISRNRRYYPKALWEKVCNDVGVRTRLTEKLMFGTIGHGQKIDEFTLLEGKMSHIVTNLQIEGNRGIGEALILDTPAGRILNTILRAGSQLRVSSRANGAFKGEFNGLPVVDPQTYVLETFDFVIDPGFFQANPKLVESLENLTLDKGEEDMNGNNSALIENLAKENGTLKADMERITTELETIKNENVTLRDEAKHLKFELDKVQGFKGLSENLKKELAAFQNMGTVAEVKAMAEALDKFTKEVGTFSQVKKALIEANKAADLLDTYKSIGPARRVKAALESAYAALGEYTKLGSVSEIKTIVKKFEEHVNEAQTLKSKTKISALAKELGVSEEKVSKLYGKMDEKEIREFFKGVEESSKISKTYRKNPVNESKPGNEQDETKKRLFSRNTTASIFESFGGGE